MLHSDRDILLMEQRKRDLLRQARLQQLYHATDATRAQMTTRLRHLLGDLMISGGERLKGRTASARSLHVQPLIKTQNP